MRSGKFGNKKNAESIKRSVKTYEVENPETGEFQTQEIPIAGF